MNIEPNASLKLLHEQYPCFYFWANKTVWPSADTYKNETV